MSVKTFLEKTGEYILENYADKLHSLCIVVPNRRAIHFLKSFLTEQQNKTFILPSFYTAEEFISYNAKHTVTDNITLLFELYQVYQNSSIAEKDSFEEFIKWAPILISDFNEIDHYLVDVSQLFSTLESEKKIEIWNPSGTNLTEFQKKYLLFWNSLLELYTNLKTNLSKKATAYQGMAARIVAENISAIEPKIEHGKIIFVGFNALSNAEEKIIRYLIKCGKADILWDADKYYTNSMVQEAGKFIRKHRKNWELKDFHWIDDNFKTIDHKIQCIGVSQNTGQAKLAGEILSTKISTWNINKTALVLSDENLLIPLLHSIPEDIKEFNITMGYPLGNSSIADLIDTLFSLHENARNFNEDNDQRVLKYYYKDILKILQNASINELFADSSTIFQTAANYIIDNNFIFISAEILNKSIIPNEDKICKTLFSFFICEWKSPQNIIFYLESLYEYLQQQLLLPKNTSNKMALDAEIVKEIRAIIKRLKGLLQNYSFFSDIKTLRHLLNQLVKSVTVPFIGEPLKGLQIMGVLETRNLDFENIIMLSVNERILPSGNTTNSFIPINIKQTFGIPTYGDKDAVYAYHFYRLLQKAENIFLVYNSESEGFGKAEKSRFISQLLQELKQYNPLTKITESLYIAGISKNTKTEKIEITKDESVYKKLLYLSSEKGFYPTTLSTYINCPLQFYFSHVANIKPLETVEETIETSTLGSIIHAVLQKLFEPFCTEKKINSTEILNLLSHVETYTNEAFREEFKGVDFESGKNLLISKVAKKLILNYLHFEKTFIESIDKSGGSTHFFGLEKKLNHEIEIILNDKSKVNIKFGGKADRIDSINNIPRIVDYKTGKVTTSELKVKNLNDVIIDSKYSKAFQLLFYGYLGIKDKKLIQTEVIEIAILSLKFISNGYMKVRVSDDNSLISTEIAAQFEELLIQLLQKILNRDIPFCQTEDNKRCIYCNYKNICNR